MKREWITKCLHGIIEVFCVHADIQFLNIKPCTYTQPFINKSTKFWQRFSRDSQTTLLAI